MERQSPEWQLPSCVESLVYKDGIGSAECRTPVGPFSSDNSLLTVLCPMESFFQAQVER